eukprot:TRINITY_DN4708_c0_g1_i1.p1 TRINITY_DN4708_c0_g1~~TRINITY_DN4708_c0_g1_i1.p1  ORF type:complete len:1153 (-),score=338.93 TRINITY_DN4708_c0_g1_i1:3352-6810(-)
MSFRNTSPARSSLIGDPSLQAYESALKRYEVELELLQNVNRTQSATMESQTRNFEQDSHKLQVHSAQAAQQTAVAVHEVHTLQSRLRDASRELELFKLSGIGEKWLDFIAQRDEKLGFVTKELQQVRDLQQEMRQHASSTDSELGTMQQYLRMYNQQISTQMETLMTDFRKVSEQNSQLLHENARLSASRDGLQAALLSAQDDVERLQSQRDLLQTECNATSTQHQELLKRWEQSAQTFEQTTREQHTSHSEQLRHLTEELEKAQSARDSLQRQGGVDGGLKRQLQLDNQKLTMSVSSLQRELDRLRNFSAEEVSAMRTQLESVNRKLALANSQLLQGSHLNAGDLERKDREIADLHEKIRLLQAYRTQSSDTSANIEKAHERKLSDLTQQQDALQRSFTQQLQFHKDEAEQLRRQLAEKSRLLEVLQREMTTIQAECSAKVAAAQLVESSAGEVQRERDELATLSQARLQTIADLQLQLESSTQRERTATERLAAAEATLRTESQLSATSARLRTKDSDDLRSQLQHTQGLLTIATAQRKQMLADHDDLSAKVEELSQSRAQMEAPVRAELKAAQANIVELLADKQRLTDEVAAMTRHFSESRGALEEMQAKLLAHDTQLLEKDLSSLSTANTQKLKIATLEQAVARLESSNQQLYTENQALSLSTGRLKETIEELQTSSAEQNAAMDQLNTDFEARESDLLKEIQRLENEARDQANASHELKEKIAEQDGRMEVLIKEHDSMLAKLRTAARERDKLTEAHQRQLNLLQESNDQLVVQLKQAQAMYTLLQSKQLHVPQVPDVSIAIQAQLEETKAEIVHLKSVNAILQERLDQSTTEHGALRKRMEQLTTENADLSSRVLRAQSESEQLRNTVSKRVSDLTDTRTTETLQRGELAASNAELRRQLEQLQSDHATTSQALQRQRAEAAVQLQTLQKQLDDNTARANSTAMGLRNAHDQAELTAAQRATDLQDKLRSALQQVQAEKSGSAAVLEDLHGKLADALAQITSLRRERDALAERAQQLQYRVQDRGNSDSVQTATEKRSLGELERVRAELTDIRTLHSTELSVLQRELDRALTTLAQYERSAVTGAPLQPSVVISELQARVEQRESELKESQQSEKQMRARMTILESKVSTLQSYNDQLKLAMQQQP